jgi:hypothetical protein
MPVWLGEHRTDHASHLDCVVQVHNDLETYHDDTIRCDDDGYPCHDCSLVQLHGLAETDHLSSYPGNGYPADDYPGVAVHAWGSSGKG